jgi:hypothetical protein
MYQHLGDLIEFIILIAIGIILIVQWKKKKKEILLWSGIILISINLIRGGIAFNDFLATKQMEKSEQEQSRIDREKLQETLKNEIAANTPLLNDTLFTFDNTVDIFVPKEFIITEHPKAEVKNLVLTKTFDNGGYIVSITKTPNTENFSFSEFEKQADNYFEKSQINYEFSPNTSLFCSENDCKIQNYKAFENGELASEGTIVYKKSGNYFYTILFMNNKVDKALAINFTEKIYNSIKIKKEL